MKWNEFFAMTMVLTSLICFLMGIFFVVTLITDRNAAVTYMISSVFGAYEPKYINCSDAAQNDTETFLTCISGMLPDNTTSIGGMCLDYAVGTCNAIETWNQLHVHLSKSQMGCMVVMAQDLRHSFNIVTVPDMNEYCVIDFGDIRCLRLLTA